MPQSPSPALHARLASVVFTSALLACSDGDLHRAQQEDDGGTLEAGSAGALRDGGASPPAHAPDATTAAFTVRIAREGAADALCPSACVELRAIAEHGVPPYSYTFEGLGAGPGPHRVCPRETTTYRVSATDSSFDGEFGGKNPAATYSLTIPVLTSCADGGAQKAGADAAVEDSGAAPAPGDAALEDAGSGGGEARSPACKRAIATAKVAEGQTGWFDVVNRSFSAKLVTDADGNALFAVGYHGAIGLSNGTSLLSGGGAFLLGKVGPDCVARWIISLEGAGAAQEPILAVDTLGRAIVVATTSGSGATPSGIYLVMVSADGRKLWERTIEAAPSLQWQRALRVDDRGDIVLLTAAAKGANFGGGPLGMGGAALDPDMVAIAKYRPDGSHAWSKVLQDEAASGAMVIDARGDVLIHAWSKAARDWGAAGRTNGSMPGRGHSYLLRIDAAGNFTWSKVIGDGDQEQYAWHGLDMDPAGQLVLSAFPGPGVLSRLHPVSGELLWKKPLLSPDQAATDWSKTAVNDKGQLVVGGDFSASTSISGVALRTPHSGSDAFVQKLGADGQVAWTYQSTDLDADPGSSDDMMGLAADDFGHVYALIDTVSPSTRSVWLTWFEP
jgi:hypothetical protein